MKAFGWDVAGSHGVIVNLTTWQSVEALAGFVFSVRHLEIMRQRRQWFHQAAEATTALWWVPSGHRPSTEEAEDRVRQLRGHGPSADSFTLRKPYPAPGQARTCTPATTGSAQPDRQTSSHSSIGYRTRSPCRGRPHSAARTAPLTGASHSLERVRGRRVCCGGGGPAGREPSAHRSTRPLIGYSRRRRTWSRLRCRKAHAGVLPRV